MKKATPTELENKMALIAALVKSLIISNPENETVKKLAAALAPVATPEPTTEPK